MRGELGDDEVHVFVARPDDVDLAIATEALPEEERRWVATFRFEKNQREHLVSRALVRLALSRYADVRPDAWQWRLGEHGKPSIDAPRGLFFNASNHPDIVVCAVARHSELGIDVEPHSRGDEIIGVASTVFSTAERAALFAIESDDARRHRAVRLWTMKEAYIKAVGAGFSAPVAEISLDLDVDPPLLSAPATFDRPGGFFFHVIDHDRGCIALAIRGPTTKPNVVLVRSPFAEPCGSLISRKAVK